MTLTPVDKRFLRCPKKDLYNMLMEFVDSEDSCVRVEHKENEYKSVMSAYSSLRNCVENMGLPIAVSMRKGDIFLIKLIDLKENVL